MVARTPLRTLSADQRKGALVAIHQVRVRAHLMCRSDGAGVVRPMTPEDRLRLDVAARAVRRAVNIVRTELEAS